MELRQAAEAQVSLVHCFHRKSRDNKSLDIVHIIDQHGLAHGPGLLARINSINSLLFGAFSHAFEWICSMPLRS